MVFRDFLLLLDEMGITDVNYRLVLLKMKNSWSAWNKEVIISNAIEAFSLELLLKEEKAKLARDGMVEEVVAPPPENGLDSGVEVDERVQIIL